ncbi:MAG: hypothetical protein IOC39_33770 [Burkholderia sp.]|jgi:hypothetical protein|uniref:hypothetical protein n=1 Tax=Burkholderia TaxID=32008 RepID=UPI0015897CF2|nr:MULTISPECIES: hypothetical protein [Burkholderia]MCA3779417.1 hypothetical protein [Burkholderia sp.]MCA3796615.1 hypothetical protein [Burkholderia sp.]MCA3804147.1 hypothetical protein [Burkholderia sp.]MCA3811623.1 hypothetical protein [Burkholderia sp.]MCA3820794.1 hypothetical protein [Burkholderia sp.]
MNSPPGPGFKAATRHGRNACCTGISDGPPEYSRCSHRQSFSLTSGSHCPDDHVADLQTHIAAKIRSSWSGTMLEISPDASTGNTFDSGGSFIGEVNLN